MQAVPFQRYWGGVVDLLKNQQDVIAELSAGPLAMNIGSDVVGEYASAQELAEVLQVSEKDLADLFEGKIPFVSLPGGAFFNTSVRKDVAGQGADKFTEVYFWYINAGTGNVETSSYYLRKQTNPQPEIYSILEV